jgi:signal transduction histidine kinase
MKLVFCLLVLIPFGNLFSRNITPEIQCFHDEKREYSLDSYSLIYKTLPHIETKNNSLNLGYQNHPVFCFWEGDNLPKDPAISIGLSVQDYLDIKWNSKTQNSTIILGDRAEIDPSIPAYPWVLKTPNDLEGFWIRIDSHDGLNEALNFQFDTKDQIEQDRIFERTVLIFYLGGILSIFLFNLSLFLRNRTPHHFSYLVYVLFYSFWMVLGNFDTGIRNQLILNEFFMICTVVFTTAFYNFLFLVTLNPSPFRSKIQSLLFLNGIPLVLFLFGYYAIAVHCIILTFFGFLFLFLTVWKSQFCILSYYRLILLCILPLVLGGSLLLLKILGWIPSTYLIEKGPMIGSYLEILLFSLFLAKAHSETKKELDQLSHDKQLVEDEIQRLKSQENAILIELEQSTQLLIQSEKLSSLGEMVAGISHEINNPMNFIEMSRFGQKEKLEDFQKYIESFIPNSPETENFRQGIRSQFEELNDLNIMISKGIKKVSAINQSMRNVSRADTTKMSVDLVELVQETLTILSFKVKDYIIETKFSQESIQFHCIRSQIEQVLMNLISNSCDALKENAHTRDKTGVIRISVELEPNAMSFSVEDSGPGIPDENKTKVMDSFFTTKPKGVGTGLGLSIAGKIIKNHQGKIQVLDSKELGGALFRVTLPSLPPQN